MAKLCHENNTIYNNSDLTPLLILRLDRQLRWHRFSQDTAQEVVDCQRSHANSRLNCRAANMRQCYASTLIS